MLGIWTFGGLLDDSLLDHSLERSVQDPRAKHHLSLGATLDLVDDSQTVAVIISQGQKYVEFGGSQLFGAQQDLQEFDITYITF